MAMTQRKAAVFMILTINICVHIITGLNIAAPFEALSRTYGNCLGETLSSWALTTAKHQISLIPSAGCKPSL